MLEDVLALDVADEVHARLAQERAGLAHQRVALRVLLAVGEQPDARPRSTEDALDVGRAHDRELDELLGSAIDVRADVAEQAVAVQSRERRRDRRPLDAADAPEPEQGRDHHRARVAGRDEAARAAGADLGDPDDERRLRLGPDGLGRLIRHLDHVRRVDDLEAGRQIAMPGQLGLDDRATPDQEHPHALLAGRLDGASDRIARSEVAAHDVEGDPNLRPGDGALLPWTGTRG